MQYLARTTRHLVADYVVKDAATLTETKAISRFAIEKFLSARWTR